MKMANGKNIMMPKIAREFVENTIIEYLGKNALSRFQKKRDAVKKELQDFKKETGLDDALQSALDIINEEE